eukprot:699144-Prorocentrum_minimum.AAC.1
MAYTENIWHIDGKGLPAKSITGNLPVIILPDFCASQVVAGYLNHGPQPSVTQVSPRQFRHPHTFRVFSGVCEENPRSGSCLGSGTSGSLVRHRLEPPIIRAPRLSGNCSSARRQRLRFPPPNYNNH